MASAAARGAARARAPGARVDVSYTATGGSGADSTALSPSLEAASAKAVRTYRAALRDVPAMRANFNIVEEPAFIRAVIRDLFERRRGVIDSKIVDMLVFKANQELREISEQWKSRYHVYAYVQEYTEKMLREEAGKLAKAEAAAGNGGDEGRRLGLVRAWKTRGLVPAEIESWEQYVHWKAGEDAKFATFAVDKGIFTKAQLDRNASPAAQSQCAIM